MLTLSTHRPPGPAKTLRRLRCARHGVPADSDYVAGAFAAAKGGDEVHPALTPNLVLLACTAPTVPIRFVLRSTSRFGVQMPRASHSSASALTRGPDKMRSGSSAPGQLVGQRERATRTVDIGVGPTEIELRSARPLGPTPPRDEDDQEEVPPARVREAASQTRNVMAHDLRLPTRYGSMPSLAITRARIRHRRPVGGLVEHRAPQYRDAQAGDQGGEFHALTRR
jgi:hypothetical protein